VPKPLASTLTWSISSGDGETKIYDKPYSRNPVTLVGVPRKCDTGMLNVGRSRPVLLAIVSSIEFGEMFLVFGQFVDGKDGVALTDGNARPAIQAPLRINKELLDDRVTHLVLTGVDILALTYGYTFIVFDTGIGNYAGHGRP
jgi:hypothetical protein